MQMPACAKARHLSSATTEANLAAGEEALYSGAVTTYTAEGASRAPPAVVGELPSDGKQRQSSWAHSIET